MLAKSTNSMTFHKSPAGKHLENSFPVLTVAPNSMFQKTQNMWGAELGDLLRPGYQGSGCTATLALPEVAPKATYMTLETGSNGCLSVCS